ncbi:MAG TPA: PqqD family protein [Trebonia sp.]|nr:PqqD family protein [Trebonia sp.]
MIPAPGESRATFRLEFRTPPRCALYQPERDRVHYLNPTANLILELCDGTLTAAQIAGLIAQTFDLAAPPDEEVNGTLAQLAAEGLTG